MIPPSRTATARALSDELVRAHGCHTVLLYGSQARGGATDASDWDFLCVKNTGVATQDARKFRGVYLDAFIETEESLVVIDEGHLRLLGAEILVDDVGYGAELLRRVVVLEQAGRPALTPEKRRHRQEWLERMLLRAQGGSTVSDFRRAWLLTELLPAYFDLRARWYPGPKYGLAWLEKNDREAYHLFSSALVPGADLQELAALVAFVVHREG